MRQVIWTHAHKNEIHLKLVQILRSISKMVVYLRSVSFLCMSPIITRMFNGYRVHLFSPDKQPSALCHEKWANLFWTLSSRCRHQRERRLDAWISSVLAYAVAVAVAHSPATICEWGSVPLCLPPLLLSLLLLLLLRISIGRFLALSDVDCAKPLLVPHPICRNVW